MSKSLEKLQAIKLRREGISIKDIAKLLKVSPGSVSLWCQSIVLTSRQQNILKDKQFLAGQAGRQKGADMNRSKRLKAISDAEVTAELTIKNISDKELFFLGLGIYWGEGVKSRTGQATVVNSDARILRIAKRWFVNCLQVEEVNFRPYIYIAKHHEHRKREIINYWTKALKIPELQFKSPIYINQNHKQKYEDEDSYYGVVALRVSKSTDLKYRILALLKVLNKRLE